MIHAQRLTVAYRGRLVADGPPAEALEHDRIRDVFGVDPALVRLPAEARSAAAPSTG